MKNNNNIEMKEHPISPVLLNHGTGALVSLIEKVTMLRICLCSTFWTQHKSYAASRYKIIRAFEKTSMLKAAINQYEGRYPEPLQDLRFGDIAKSLWVRYCKIL